MQELWPSTTRSPQSSLLHGTPAISYRIMSYTKRFYKTKSNTSYLYYFSTIPDSLKWLRYISWFNFGFENFMINQWRDVHKIDGNYKIDVVKFISVFCWYAGAYWFGRTRMVPDFDRVVSRPRPKLLTLKNNQLRVVYSSIFLDS